MKKTVISFLIIGAVALIVYSNTFNSPFHYDDAPRIVDNASIGDINRFAELSFWTKLENRPLAAFTFTLNYRLGGLNVTGYHVFNIFIHILMGIFAFLLTREIIRLPQFRNTSLSGHEDLFALFTALVCIVHPVQTQAVTYIVQRMTSFASMFYILSLLLYIKGRVRQIERCGSRAVLLYSGALCAGMFGLLSKQTAVTFPAAFLLIELCFIRSGDGELFWRYIAVAASSLVVLIVLYVAVAGLPVEYRGISRSEYCISQLKVIVKYIQLLLFPINQSVEHHIAVSKSLTGWREIISLMLLLLITGAGAVMFRRKRLVAFGIFFFFLALSVESSIIPIRHFIFEHRLYLPMYGFSIIVVSFIFNLLSKKRYYLIAIVSSLVVLYGAVAFSRNTVWQTSFSLWKDAVNKSPEIATAWYNLGINYSEMGNYSKAIECFNTAIRLDPQYAEAYNNRGLARKNARDVQGALQDYNRAIQFDPNHGIAYYNRAIFMAEQGRHHEAVDDYTRAVGAGYDNALVYYNRANAKWKMRDFAGALEDYALSIKRNRSYSVAYYNRGLLLAEMQRTDEGIRDMDSAVELDPKNPLFYYGRGLTKMNAGKEGALSDFDTAIRLSPRYAGPYFSRGGLRKRNNDYAGACDDWKMALRYGDKRAEGMMRMYCR